MGRLNGGRQVRRRDVLGGGAAFGASGLFDLNGNSDHIGSLTMQGGTVDSGGGTLFLGGNVATVADVNTAFIEGHLSLGGASRVFGQRNAAHHASASRCPHVF